MISMKFHAPHDHIEAESNDKDTLWITGRSEHGHDATFFIRLAESRQIINEIVKIYPDAIIDQQSKWLEAQTARTLATIDRVFGAPIEQPHNPVDAVIKAMEPAKV